MKTLSFASIAQKLQSPVAPQGAPELTFQSVLLPTEDDILLVDPPFVTADTMVVSGVCERRFIKRS